MVPALSATLCGRSVEFTNEGEAELVDDEVDEDVDDDVDDGVEVWVDESELSIDWRIDEVG
jgi:hypothetical protein